MINQETIDKAVEKYSFRVPYDGSNNFYDEEAAKHFLAGVKFATEEINKIIFVNGESCKHTYVIHGTGWERCMYCGLLKTT